METPAVRGRRGPRRWLPTDLYYLVQKYMEAIIPELWYSRTYVTPVTFGPRFNQIGNRKDEPRKNKQGRQARPPPRGFRAARKLGETADTQCERRRRQQLREKEEKKKKKERPVFNKVTTDRKATGSSVFLSCLIK